MALELHADDVMPWGPYKGKTLRDVYHKNSNYVRTNVFENDSYLIGTMTKFIIENNIAMKDESQVSYSKWSKGAKIEFKPDTIINFGNVFYGKTLQEVFDENKSYFRFIVNNRFYFISEETFNIVSSYSNILMSKLMNKEASKYFTKSEFSELADWSNSEHPKSESKKFYEITGNRIYYDSKTELMLLKHIDENNLAQICAGQVLSVQYNSQFKLNKNYYPDVVMLTLDNRIAIIEVKPISAMSHHSNIEKYEALRNYCKDKGYMYTMVDPDNNYMSFEDLIDYEVAFEIEDEIDYWINSIGDNEYSCFQKDEVEEWYAFFEPIYTKKEFELQLHSIIIKKGLFNNKKYGFRVYSRPVSVDKEGNVIKTL